MTGQGHEDLRQMAVDHLWLPFHQMNDFAETPESLRIYKSGDGCWLTDINGRKAFDMMSKHPAVIGIPDAHPCAS